MSAAAVDALLDLELIERAARGVRAYGVEIDDLVAETALGWLQRARSQPEHARQHPGRMARWAARDAVRRLTGSRRAGRLELADLGDRVLADVAELYDPADDETEAQAAEWRALPTSERLHRIAEAEAALGSSPSLAARPAACPNGGGSHRRTRAWYEARGLVRGAPRVCVECGRAIGRHAYAGVRTCSQSCGRAREARPSGATG